MPDRDPWSLVSAASTTDTGSRRPDAQYLGKLSYRLLR